MNKLGFGGGCHWCTEAVFQSILGVTSVQQGWIGSLPPYDSLSEAVLVSFDDRISFERLIEIHLLTHSSTSNHSRREKYRSAIYYLNEIDEALITDSIRRIGDRESLTFITQALPFQQFQLNREDFLDYYQRNKTAPFCEAYIHPKLALIREKFASEARTDF